MQASDMKALIRHTSTVINTGIVKGVILFATARLLIVDRPSVLFEQQRKTTEIAISDTLRETGSDLATHMTVG